MAHYPDKALNFHKFCSSIMQKGDPREYEWERLLVEIGTHDREVGSSIPIIQDIPYVRPCRART